MGIQALDDVVLKDGSTLRLRAPEVGRQCRGGGVLRAAVGREPLPPVPRRPEGDALRRRAVSRPRLGRARRSDRHARRQRRRRACRRAGELRASARPRPGGGRLRRRGRPAAARHRNPAARAACRARGSDRDRAVRGAGDGREPADAERLRAHRLRGDARAGAGRDRGRVPDRSDRRASSSRSTGETTPPCAPRSSRSSRRARSQCSARRRDAARSAASSFATSSARTSRALRTRSTATGVSVAGVHGYAGGRRDPRTRSISRSSACRANSSSSSAEACLRRGIRALCVISAGFAETGVEGAARQQELLGLVRAHGGRLIGPNCLGVAVAGLVAERDVRAEMPCPSGTSASRRRAARSALALIEAAGARGLGLVGVRVDRQQGRRLLERPARVVGGRRGDRGSSCSTSSRSATRASSRASPAGSRARSRSSR